MSGKRFTAWDSLGHVIWTAFAGGLAVIYAVGIFHAARYFGASELAAATYTIVAAISVGFAGLPLIIDTAVNSLHVRIDEIVDELQRLRKGQRDH